ncbi:MAG: redoxin domain-containing protein, partial [Paraprevotella sp.]|nr:redoxin domain-containing protein [Paraprevotella sp.]
MKIGDKVPEWLGYNENGEKVLMSDFLGKKLVLYFYPKDNTSGCTAEACSLRDNYSDLKDNFSDSASSPRVISDFNKTINL